MMGEYFKTKIAMRDLALLSTVLSVDAVLEFLNKKNLVKSVLFVGSVFDLFV